MRRAVKWISVALWCLLGISVHAQTTSVTGTFKTAGGQTPVQAGLRPLTTVNGTQVYGTAEFEPYDQNGKSATRIVCNGITFLPEAVQGWIRGDGALVSSDASATSVALVPTKNCQPANLVYRAVYSLNGTSNGRVNGLSWTEFKEIPQMTAVDWAQLSIVSSNNKAAFSYVTQNGGTVLDYLDFNNNTGVIPPNPPPGYCRAYFDTTLQKLRGVTNTGTDCNPGGAGSLASLNGLTGPAQSLTKVDDTNVTLGIVSSGTAHTFTLGWAGTLAKNRQNASTVYTDQANTFSAGVQDFGAASNFVIPKAAGANPTADGNFAIDTTTHLYKVGVNGATKTLATTDASITGNAATATAFASAPSTCSGNNFALGIAVSGNANCAQPAFSNLSGSATVGQIPSLPASQIGSGQIALTRGGTAADLSATGGASQVLKQTTLGGAITVGQLNFTDMLGTVTKAQQPATDVFTDQANIYSTGAQDFSAAASLKIVIGAGLAPTVSGQVGYDSTANKFVFGQNGLSVSFGLSSSACSANQFVNSPATGTAQAGCAQPVFSNLSGTATVGQIPSLPASQIGSGQVALARGGTNADLSSTGGASQVLKQTTVGGPITVGQLVAADVLGVPVVVGNPGDLQSTTGSVLQASGLNDDGSKLTASRDFQFVGPNPVFDIRGFGGRAPASIPQTTCTTTGGSVVVNLASGTGFQNGDGITCLEAGATLSISTPTAPTVVASNAGAGTGTGIVVANSSGATQYCYSVRFRTTDGQLTPNSPETCIANGDSALGVHTVNISSWTRSGTTVTVTTASPHNLVVNSMVRLGGTSDTSMLGNYRVATVPDNTHFTFAQNIDTANSAATASGNTAVGTASWYTLNQITCPTVTGGHQCYIYGRATGLGTKTLLGVTLPQNASETGSILYNTWSDFGSTMSAAPSFPDWVPTVDSASGKNGNLSTTIVSGGGTNTVTLATTATNAVSGKKFVLDQGPILQNASNTIGAGGGVLYIPAGTPGTFTTYSFVTLNASRAFSIVQQGNFAIGDTILNTNRVTWSGKALQSAPTPPQFARSASPTIFGGTAYPMFYNKNSGVEFDHLTVKNTTANGLAYLQDDGGIPNSVFSWVQFQTGQGVNDYVSYAMLFRGANSTGGSAQTKISDSVFTSGPGDNTIVDTPLLLFSWIGSPVELDNLMFDNRTIFFDTTTNGIQVSAKNLYVQGPDMPFVSTICRVGAGKLQVHWDTAVMDSAQWPFVNLYAGMNGITSLYTMFGNGPKLVSPPAQVAVYEDTISSANASGSVTAPTFTAAVDGYNANTLATVPIETHNSNILLGRAGQIAVMGPLMAAPTCAVSAGGSVAVGTYIPQVAPVYAGGGEGPLSPVGNTCVTSSGNQTVTITWTPLTNQGVVGYDIYFPNTNQSLNVFGSPFVVGGASSSYVWTNAGVVGQKVQSAGSGPTVINRNGVQTTQLVFPGLNGAASANKSTWTAPTLTAARTVTVPDTSGQVVLTPLGSGFGPNHIVMTNTSGQQIDSGVPPMHVYDSAAWPNGAISTSNPNWTTLTGTINYSSNTITAGAAATSVASYTGTTFAPDNQWASVRVAVAGTSASAQAGPALRITNASNWYACDISRAGAGNIEIRKNVAGTQTALTNVAYVPSVDDVVSFSAVNTSGSSTVNLKCYVNGVQVLSTTDTSLGVGGTAGIYTFNTNTLALSNFLAGPASVSLNSPQTWNAVQTAGTGGGFDANASTSLTAGLRMPNVAGANPSTAGALAYDTTNKNGHLGANGVDNLIDLHPATVTPSNNDCVKWTVSSGTVTTNTAGAPCGTTTPSSSDTFTNKTIDAEGTGNSITVPTKLFFRTALCNNGTAGFAADATSATPTVACFGTTTKIGVWQAADVDALTWSYLLPSDFTGNIDAKLAFNSPDSSGTVIFNIALACVDGSGATADDPAYNASSAFGTVTLASPANASWTTAVSNVTKSGTTPCSAGSWMNIKLTRATDTATSRVNVKSLEITARRAM